jgi:hypothetical protein
MRWLFESKNYTNWYVLCNVAQLIMDSEHTPAGYRKDNGKFDSMDDVSK